MPVNPESQNPTGKKHPRKAKNPRLTGAERGGTAHRTRTEIGQMVPTSNKEEKAKTGMLQATAAGKTHQAKLIRKYQKSLASTNLVDRKTRHKIKKYEQATRAAAIRKAAKRNAIPTKMGGFKRPNSVLASELKQVRQTKKKIRHDRAEYEKQRWEDASVFEKWNMEGGAAALGIVSPRTAHKVRRTVMGSKNPNLGQYALTFGVPGAGIAAAKVGAKVLPKVLRTAEGVSKARAEAKAARDIETVSRAGRRAKSAEENARRAAAAERGATATARTARASKRAARAKKYDKLRQSAKARYSGPMRALRRKKRFHRAAVTAGAAPPALAAGGANPGDVGKRITAFGEGHLKANPGKALVSTAEAVPALFSYLGTVAGGAAKSVSHGDPGYLGGALEAGGEGLVDILKEYGSGDPERVAKALEDYGYPEAPLAPRGFISRPAKFLGRGTRSAAIKAVPRRIAETESGQKFIDFVGPTGKAKRKRVAVTMDREASPPMFRAREATEDMTREANQAPGARGKKEVKPGTGVYYTHQTEHVTSEPVAVERSKKKGKGPGEREKLTPAQKRHLDAWKPAGSGIGNPANRTIQALERKGYIRKAKDQSGVTGGGTRYEIVQIRGTDTGMVHGPARQFELPITHRRSREVQWVKNTEGPEALQAAMLLAHAGITRKAAKTPGAAMTGVNAWLKTVESNPHLFEDTNITNVRQTMRWLQRNPHVLRDDHFWNVNDLYRGAVEEHTTSRVATNREQARIVSHMTGETIHPPEHRNPRPVQEALADETIHGKPIETRMDALNWVDNERKLVDKTANAIKGKRGELRTAKKEAKRKRPPAYREGKSMETRAKNLQVGDSVKVNGRFKKLVVAEDGRVAWREGNKTVSKEFKANERVIMRRPVNESKLETLRHQQDVERLTTEIADLKAQMVARQERLNEVYGNLKHYHDPRSTDASIRLKRKPWDKAMVDEFVDELRAKRPEWMDDAAWMASHSTKYEDVTHGGPVSPATPYANKAVHISTGKTEIADAADRAAEQIFLDTFYRPARAKGLKRGIRKVLEEPGNVVKVEVPRRDGKRGTTLTHVVTDPEEHALAQEWYAWRKNGRKGPEPRYNPKKMTLLPSTGWGQANFAYLFDEPDNAFAKRLNRELEVARDQGDKGVKSIIVPNEVARELTGQLRTDFGPISSALTKANMWVARAILFQPAWVAAQFVNEGTQGGVGVGFHSMAKAVHDIESHLTPTQKNAILHLSGPANPSAKPIPQRGGLTREEFKAVSDMNRRMRRTVYGRQLQDFFTLKTFGNIDRWKGTRFRAAVMVAKGHKEFNKMRLGLGASNKEIERLSRKMAGMDRAERTRWMADHPEELRPLQDYLDDVMGNWRAFSRHERAWGPAMFAFYPYLRMSLRWTFWAFPKNHPIKASILYFLAQQNRDQLTELFGSEPTFLQGAMPVLVNKEGEPEGVLPAGARFGAPGSNTLVEAMGEGNYLKLINALNPVLGGAIRGATGTSPITGEQVARPNDPEAVVNNIFNQFLNMPSFLRAAGASERLGFSEKSDVSKAFDQMDPDKAIRSFLWPFMPADAQSIRDQAILSKALRDSNNKPEFYELFRAFHNGDKAEIMRLAEAVDLSQQARDVIKRYTNKVLSAEEQRRNEKDLEKAGEVDREGTGGLRQGRKVRRSNQSRASSRSGSGGGGWLND